MAAVKSAAILRNARPNVLVLSMPRKITSLRKEWIHWAITIWSSSLKNTGCKGGSGEKLREFAADERQKQERSDQWGKDTRVPPPYRVGETLQHDVCGTKLIRRGSTSQVRLKDVYCGRLMEKQRGDPSHQQKRFRRLRQFYGWDLVLQKQAKVSDRKTKLDTARRLCGIYLRNSRMSWKMRVENWKIWCPLWRLANFNVASTPSWRTRDKTHLFSWSWWICEETWKDLKNHEDLIAEKGWNNALSQYNLVQFVPMHQAMEMPDVEAAVEK